MIPYFHSENGDVIQLTDENNRNLAAYDQLDMGLLLL